MIVCHCFQAGSAAKQGLHELETVISSATSLGLKLPVSKNTLFTGPRDFFAILGRGPWANQIGKTSTVNP